MINLDKLDTEKRNVNTMNLSNMTALEMVTIINEEDKKVAEAIEFQKKEIAIIITSAYEAIENGGRLIYIGSGTSGRIGILDAVECLPTFGVGKKTINALIAGGIDAFETAQEGAEDSKELAIKQLKEIKLEKKDYLIGITASGRTPFVIGALEYAKSIEAKTASIAITSNSEVAKYADDVLEVVVGAEVLTGSSRMKAGTAQKMILNMISTSVMVLSGKTYQNLMVDIQQTNLKLKQRALNIIQEATKCSPETAKEKIVISNGDVKLAIIMILKTYSFEEAKNHLKENNDRI